MDMVMHLLLITSSPIHLENADAFGSKFIVKNKREILGKLRDANENRFENIEDISRMLFENDQSGKHHRKITLRRLCNLSMRT